MHSLVSLDKMAKKNITVAALMAKIRDLINDSLLHHLFLKSPYNFNMMCSAMDTMEDTDLAISAFLSQTAISEDGMLYLVTYGL
jgi:hypothetical protein